MTSLVVVVADVYVDYPRTGSARFGSDPFAVGVNRPSGLASSRVLASLPARPSEYCERASAVFLLSAVVPVEIIVCHGGTIRLRLQRSTFCRPCHRNNRTTYQGRRLWIVSVTVDRCSLQINGLWQDLISIDPFRLQSSVKDLA